MAHGTAFHPVAAPGMVPQGVMGPPGAGPRRASAGAVAGAGAQEWQEECENFTINARSVPSVTVQETVLVYSIKVW